MEFVNRKEKEMLMRRVVMLVVTACVLGMLTGCGVPQEEYDAKIAELNDAWGEIDTLKGKVADLESLLKAETGKVRSTRIELDDASKRIKELMEQEAASATALAEEKGKVAELESDLASAKSATGMAEDRTDEIQAALDTLQAQYDALKARFDQYVKNMRALGGEPPAEVEAPAAAPVEKESAGSESESALDILDDMSMQ